MNGNERHEQFAIDSSEGSEDAAILNAYTPRRILQR
jgi:hypothetical protein